MRFFFEFFLHYQDKNVYVVIIRCLFGEFIKCDIKKGFHFFFSFCRKIIFHKSTASPHQRLIILSFVVLRENNAVCSAFMSQESKDTTFTKLSLMTRLNDNLGHTHSVVTQIGKIITKCSIIV